MEQHTRKPAGHSTVGRREFLRVTGAAAAGLAVGPFVLRRAGAGDAFSWRRFAGQSIFVQFIKHPWSDTLEKMLPDFEKLTGIKVEFAELPEIQARQKVAIEFTGGAAGIDVWDTGLHVEKRRFTRAGWYTDLGRFLSDPTMTAPDYDWSDIAPSARQVATQPDGKVLALPFSMDACMLFYRKDLFNQHGLKPPKTLAEMEDAAQKLHSPPALYGFVGRGLKNANVPYWDWLLFSFGGNFLTRDGRASVDTPEAVRALTWYAGMLQRFAPPGVVNFNWYECSAAFMQSQVAMYYDSSLFSRQLEDREKSKVAGRVGYAPLPAGPAGRFSVGAVDGLAISSQSKHPGPAYFFAQWATAKGAALAAHLAGVPSTRLSVWAHPDVRAKSSMPLDWADAYVESLKVWRLSLPEITAVTEYRDIVGLAIQKAIEGAKPTEVLAQAQKEFQELLDKTEK